VPAEKGAAVILIVEDRDDQRRLWVDWLTHNGYVVRGVATGGEAIAAALDVTPQLVVIDLSLPDMTGFELVESIRPLGDFPIVGLAGSECGRLDHLGLAEVLREPINNAEMLAVADRLMPSVTPPKGCP